MDHLSLARPDGRTQSSPLTASKAKNNYQLNVSRQKTKKWVEAKSQNYDGDDWGAEDEYEQDPEPASQQSWPTPPSQAHQAAGPPSPSPSGSGLRPVGDFRPRTVSLTCPQSPLSPVDVSSWDASQATASKPLPFVRPPELYRRMEEERSRASTESSRPSAEIGSNLSKHTSASPVRTAAAEDTKSTAPRIPAPRSDSYKAVYQYQHLTSDFNTEPQRPRAATAAAAPSRDPASSLATSKDNLGDGTDDLSSSPKLPDLARISVFGADLFSSTSFHNSLSSQQISEQNIPQVPKVAPELKVDKPATRTSTDDDSPAPAPASEKKSEAASAPSAASAASSGPATVSAASPGSNTLNNASKLSQHQLPVTAAVAQLEARSLAATSKQVTASSSDSNASSKSTASAAGMPINAILNQPLPFQRTSTFSTDTSSPIKESDVLREEIIQTLNTPSASNAQSVGTGRSDDTHVKQSQNNNRESNYTLKDYDSYWADSDNTREASMEHTPSHNKTMSAVKEETGEAGKAAAAVVPISVKALDSAQVAEGKPPHMPPPVESDTPATSIVESPAGLVAAASQVSQPSVLSQPSQAKSVSPVSTNVHRRFSWEAEPSPKLATEPSTVPSADAAVPAISSPTWEPTSPNNDSSISLTEDEKPQQEPASRDVQSGQASKPSAPPILDTDYNSPEESRPPSHVDEKSISKTSSNQTSASQPEEDATLKTPPVSPPVLQTPTKAPNGGITPFKGIMNISSSWERVAKFNESRVSFAVMDIGLDRWLTALYQEHPEHMPEGPNSYQPPGISRPGAAPETQPAAQQPYYQQYLNANAPGNASSPNRRMTGTATSSNVGGSGFSHSSNQFGTKSKELMHSAGKMGKGLFSKGKNKLRGSGDKADSNPYPPSPQAKTRHGRQASWPMLASKLRAELASLKGNGASYEECDQGEERASSPSGPRTSMVAPCLPEPKPILPLISAIRETTSGQSLAMAWTGASDNTVHALSEKNIAAAAAAAPPDMTRSHQIRLVPSEPTTVSSAGLPPSPPPKQQQRTAAEDGGAAMLSQADQSDKSLNRRQSSFVGLPPIRRSSTFGIKARTRRAAQRFPLDVNDESGDGRTPSLPRGANTAVSTALQPGAAQQPSREVGDPTTVQTPAGQTAYQIDSASPHKQAPIELSSKPALKPRRLSPQKIAQLHSNYSAGPPLLRPPGQQTGWRLEESHLTEPLQSFRNRSGYSPVSTPISYSFDKEIGYPAVMPKPKSQPQPQPQLPSANTRTRSADIPPSSAQRYPGLFAQRPDQESTTQRQVKDDASSENVVSSRHGGCGEYSVVAGVVGPPAEERGRVRPNSGIFSEIDDKIIRAASRDGSSSSFSESCSRPAPPLHNGGHVDEASDSSFGMGAAGNGFVNRKKQRSSLFDALAATGFNRDKSGDKLATPGSVDRQQQVSTGVEAQLAPKKNRFSAIVKALQRPGQNQRRSMSEHLVESASSVDGAQRPSSRGRILSSLGYRGRNDGFFSPAEKSLHDAGHGNEEEEEGVSPHRYRHRHRRASFSNLLSAFTGYRSGSRGLEDGRPLDFQQQQQQQGRDSEPRYAAVPIPRGYAAVYAEGSTQVPSVYRPGRRILGAEDGGGYGGGEFSDEVGRSLEMKRDGGGDGGGLGRDAQELSAVDEGVVREEKRGDGWRGVQGSVREAGLVASEQDAVDGGGGKGEGGVCGVEEEPKMLATSYPGQEWNPYGEHGYEW